MSDNDVVAMSDGDDTSSPALPAFFRSRVFKPVFIAALVIYFFYLIIANVPASLAAWAVKQAMPNLWLTSVTGTLWDGRAGGAQVDVGGQTIPLGRVEWSLSPWTLFILQPCLTFDTQVPGQMLSGNICRSPFGTLLADDVSIEAPASVLKQALSVDDAVGQISIQVIKADMDGTKVNNLDARFSWQDAGIFFNDAWLALGSIGGQALSDDQGGVKGKILDISGPYGFDLDFNGQLGSDNWAVKGTVTPREGANPQIVAGLRAFGEEISTGVFQVQYP